MRSNFVSIIKNIAFVFIAIAALPARAQYQQNPVVNFYNNEISLADAINDMKKSGEDKAAIPLITQALQNTHFFNVTQAQVATMFDAIAKDGAQQSPAVRFPTVPLKFFAGFDQNASAALQDASNQAAAAHKPQTPPTPYNVNADIAILNETLCKHTVTLPSVLTPTLPDIKMGSFEDSSQSDCQKEKGVALARILNHLARQDISQFRFLNQPIDSAFALMSALVNSGHTVKLLDGRTFADFLDFVYKDQAVIMPFWMDTGLQYSDGSEIILPTGHSEWIWQISGNVVDTTVRFYIGEGGLIFDSNVDLRPYWTGYISNLRADTSTPEGQHTVEQAMEVAEGIVRRNHLEADGLWYDGYGYVGVCNDTTAMLEAALFPQAGIDAYPLLRHPHLLLSGFPEMDDGLDDLFTSVNKLLFTDIPNATPSTTRLATIKRMVQMMSGPSGAVGSVVHLNFIDLNPSLLNNFNSLNKELN